MRRMSLGVLLRRSALPVFRQSLVVCSSSSTTSTSLGCTFHSSARCKMSDSRDKAAQQLDEFAKNKEVRGWRVVNM